MSKPSAPAHLRRETAAWWRSVVGEFDLEPHHRRLLSLAATAWDRAQEARETLAAEGTYFTDRFGQPRKHPAVTVERDSQIAFARLLRELALDVEPPESRPPALRGR